MINVSRAILTHYTTPDLLAIACRPVQISPNSFRHVITVVAARSYFLLQSLDSKSNEPCFPHEVLVLVPELSRQVKNEEYVVLDDFNSLKLQSSYKIYTSPNKLSLVQLYSIYHH